MAKRTNGRIKVPRNIEARLTLAAAIFKKHTDDDINSPLKMMVDHDWTITGPQVEEVLDIHEQAEDLRRRSEALYKKRDLMMANIDKIIRASANTLKGIHSQNIKRLGEWGYEVSDSPPAKKNKDEPPVA